jgi:hypothetical protein
VPSGDAITIRGRVVRSEGRKHWTESQIENESGVVLAKANGLFIAMTR